MKIKYLTVAFSFLLTAAAAQAAKGRAVINGTSDDSQIAGTVLLEDKGKNLHITAKIENAPPGEHGFHIHEFGSCADSGKAAGGHYNPKGSDHGHFEKDGMKKAHIGDLGNITIGENGTGTLEATLKKVSLSDGKYNVGGRAFILHAKKDDFGQPTGNAGGRIGCGSIVITE